MVLKRYCTNSIMSYYGNRVNVTCFVRALSGFDENDFSAFGYFYTNFLNTLGGVYWSYKYTKF